MVISFAQWLENAFEDMFGDGWKNRPKVLRRDPPQAVPYTLTLYRGFNVDLDALEREGEYLVLSPKRSEQGLIWFTHNFIRGYDPIEYVKGRGEYILTYPLKCKRHIQVIHYDDGSTVDMIPQETMDKTNPYENCPFHMGIELPKGWVFSYKMEKFVGCSNKLRITRDMLHKNEE